MHHVGKFIGRYKFGNLDNFFAFFYPLLFLLKFLAYLFPFLAAVFRRFGFAAWAKPCQCFLDLALDIFLGYFRFLDLPCAFFILGIMRLFGLRGFSPFLSAGTFNTFPLFLF